MIKCMMCKFSRRGGNFAGGEHPGQFMGFKYGLFQDVEIGIDLKVSDKPHAHAMFQTKYAFDMGDLRSQT